jgi:hypothetical protein
MNKTLLRAGVAGGAALAISVAVLVPVLSGSHGSTRVHAVSSQRTTARPSSPSSSAVTSAAAPTASASGANSVPGTRAWGAGISFAPTSPVVGFADHDSVLPGVQVRLYIKATTGPVSVSAYRMGWYAGTQGKLVARFPPVTDVQQPPSTLIAATRTVSAADWHPSLTVDTAGWEPGDYLFLLQDAAGHGRWIPLTVRSASTAGAIVLVNADTTWQAYNAFGGYSLYHGPNGAYATRSYAVSFDRPIDYGGGSGDFYGNELPVVSLAEKLDLPVAYVTDTDLDADPHLLDGARAVISLGHDEYWSAAMRAEVTHDRDVQALNVAFLGANAVYRHIRMAATALGPERLEIDYKDGALDPLARTDPSQATYQWRDGPDPRPESVLTGAYYQCNPVHANMVVADSSSWLFTGVQVTNGSVLTGLAGQEYDSVDLAVPTPRPMDVLFHSPVSCRGAASFQDSVYYTVPSGAGGFDSGTSAWVCGLTPTCSRGDTPFGQQVTIAVTTNLLQAFAAGPCGLRHPAHDDVAQLGIVKGHRPQSAPTS